MAGVAKVTFNGETWIDVTDKTVTENKMLTTGTALDKKGDSITGSIASKTSSNVTFSGATVNVPAGAYSSAVSKTMNTAEVSVGADSSAVTNHAITITPKATVASNKDGYIAAGTITGTGVTVRASQLVSGNMEIEANGTGFNVTNFATVSVAVPTSSRKATVVGSSPDPDSTFVQYNNLFYDTDGQEFDFAQSQSLYIYAQGGSSGQIIIDGTDMHTDEYTYTLPNSDIYIMFSAVGTAHKIEISTESVPAMDLPTAPVTTAVGTKVGDNIERNTVTRYLNIPVGYNDTAQYYQIAPVNNMTLPTGTSNSHSGNLKATIGVGVATRYLNIPAGYNENAMYYTISPVSLQNKTVDPSTSQQVVNPDSGYDALSSVTVTAMSEIDFPDDPETTAVGTKVGNNITRNTATRYLNIPVGYNATAKYYQITAISNLTLPTTTSANHTGYNTLKATINPDSSTRYLNIPVGYNTTASYYTISPLNNQNKSVDPSTSQQTITADSGYTGLGTVTVNAIFPISLPTATTTNPLGVKKATLSRATATKYLNIGTGYNDTASYYEIPGITNMVKNIVDRSPTGALEDTIGRSTSTRYLTLSEGYNPDDIYYTISAVPDGSYGSASWVPFKYPTTNPTALRVGPGFLNFQEGYFTSAPSVYTDLTLESKTANTSTSAQTITPTGNTYYLNSVTVNPVTTSGISAGNIKSGATVKVGDSADDDRITSVTGTFTKANTVSSGQTAATASQILSGYSAWVDGAEVKGSVSTKASSDMYFSLYSGQLPSVVAPAGYYASDARFMIQKGTEGTPTATTGTVSNHVITITPSVQNTEGYIFGGTKTGDAVTVSATQLVSGNINITSSGTTNVEVYATATVPAGEVESPTSISGSSATSSVSSTTITLTKDVSVTPNVTTAGYVTTGTATTATVSLSAPITTKTATTFFPSTNVQTIASGTYLRGAQTIAKVVTSGISAENIKDGVVIKVGDTSNNTRIAGVTGTFTDSSTVSDGQTAATASQILSGYSAWVDGAEVQGSVATMTLPTAPTTSSSGTKIGSNIARSTSTRYLNIPAGYNPTASYYQISAVANMTLPTATSTSSSGTAKLTIEPGASNKYLNIPTGYNGTASYYTISPGMTFETGTWTPTSDIARGTISFASTHSSMPLYVCVFDQTQTTHATGSPSYMMYMDEYQIFGATFPSNTNFRYGCITSLFKTDSGTNTYTGTLQYPSTNTGNSSTAYPRYWVTESEFYPYSGSTARYWRSGRTYKWLAVWKAQ